MELYFKYKIHIFLFSVTHSSCVSDLSHQLSFLASWNLQLLFSIHVILWTFIVVAWCQNVTHEVHQTLLRGILLKLSTRSYSYMLEISLNFKKVRAHSHWIVGFFLHINHTCSHKFGRHFLEKEQGSLTLKYFLHVWTGQ